MSCSRRFHMGPEGVPALARALGDKRWLVRTRAARVLRDMGPKVRDAIPNLIEAACRHTLGAFAAEALGHLGARGKEAVPALTAALADSSAAVRRRAAEALGKIGPEAAPSAPWLIQALGDDSSVRSAAAEALFHLSLADEQAVPALIEALRCSDPYVVSVAAEALVAIGRPALPALVREARDEKPSARRRATRALGNMGPAAADAVPALIEALHDPDPDLRPLAAEALGDIGADSAIPALRGTLEGRVREVIATEAVAQAQAERLEAAVREALAKICRAAGVPQ